MNACNGKDSTVTLMVPYAYGDAEKDFNYVGEQLDSQKYSKMMIDSYKSHKDGVYETYVERAGMNMAINNFTKEDNTCTQTQYYFGETKVNIYNGDGSDIVIDELIHYYQSGKPFVLIVDMYQIGNSTHADLQTDMRSWARECEKITNYPKFSQAEKIQYLSKKSMKIKFDDAKSSAILKNCKMIDRIGKFKFVFLVERIIFVAG